MRSPQPLIPKPAKSSAPPKSRVRPGYETPAISARGGRGTSNSTPSRKLACFCSAPMAGFYSAVDIVLRVKDELTTAIDARMPGDLARAADDRDLVDEALY